MAKSGQDHTKLSPEVASVMRHMFPMKLIAGLSWVMSKSIGHMTCMRLR